MTFGQKLLDLRKARGWSQEELAAQIGVSRQALSKWENDAALPDTENLVAVAKLFGVTTDYLLGAAAADGPTAYLQPQKAPAWRLGCRIAGATVAVLALVGLLVIGILSSVFPADHMVATSVAAPAPNGSSTNTPTEVGFVRRTGLDAFLHVHNLGWLFALCIALVFVGVFLLFLPNLVDLKRKLSVKWDAWGES